MSETEIDVDATEVLHCPECGQKDSGFDGQGSDWETFTKTQLVSDDYLKDYEVRRVWYQFHCADCGAVFRTLENERETPIEGSEQELTV